MALCCKQANPLGVSSIGSSKSQNASSSKRFVRICCWTLTSSPWVTCWTRWADAAAPGKTRSLVPKLGHRRRLFILAVVKKSVEKKKPPSTKTKIAFFFQKFEKRKKNAPKRMPLCWGSWSVSPCDLPPQVINEVDTSGLGTLNLDEFKQIMQLNLGQQVEKMWVIFFFFGGGVGGVFLFLSLFWERYYCFFPVWEFFFFFSLFWTGCYVCVFLGVGTVFFFWVWRAVIILGLGGVLFLFFFGLAFLFGLGVFFFFVFLGFRGMFFFFFVWVFFEFWRVFFPAVLFFFGGGLGGVFFFHPLGWFETDLFTFFLVWEECFSFFVWLWRGHLLVRPRQSGDSQPFWILSFCLLSWSSFIFIFIICFC